MKTKKPGKCCHCGKETFYAWVDTRMPNSNQIHVCITCIGKAQVGSYATPAYERVGQATYTMLLKPREGEAN